MAEGIPSAIFESLRHYLFVLDYAMINMDNYEFGKGETILIPADMPDFFLVPRDRSTLLLEATTRHEEAVDGYIDPTTEAFLENEDYEGLENEDEE